MALAQTVKSKLIIQYVAVLVLLVTGHLVCSKTIENTCPTNCSCWQDSLACIQLDLTEIPTAILPEHVLSFVFSNNKLTYLMERAFRDYRFLEYLNLSENEIEGVDSRAFHDLARMNNIDLSYNNLHYITPAIFSDNPVLEKVSFRGNQLAYFPDSPPILASHSIASLDLSYCALTSINADTFSQLPNLQTLNLNNNKLREFNREILNTLTKLSNVVLGNNKWKCDCNIVEILNWLSERRKSKGLLGEHEPVKCEDAGVRKTIWSSTSRKELCSELAEILPNASALKAPTASSDSTTDAKVSTDTPTTSKSKNEMENIVVPVSMFSYITILCVTFSLILLISVGMALFIVSLSIFSKEPLTLPLNRSEFLTKAHDFDSSVYIRDRSNDLQKITGIKNNWNGKKTE